VSGDDLRGPRGAPERGGGATERGTTRSALRAGGAGGQDDGQGARTALTEPGRGGTPAHAVRGPGGGSNTRADGCGGDRDGGPGRRRDPGRVIAAGRHAGNRGHGTIDTRKGR